MTWNASRRSAQKSRTTPLLAIRAVNAVDGPREAEGLGPGLISYPKCHREIGNVLPFEKEHASCQVTSVNLRFVRLDGSVMG